MVEDTGRGASPEGEGCPPAADGAAEVLPLLLLSTVVHTISSSPSSTAAASVCAAAAAAAPRARPRARASLCGAPGGHHCTGVSYTMARKSRV